MSHEHLRNLPYHARIADSQLIISIGLTTLCFAAMNADDMGDIEVKDENLFANAILAQLEKTDENGFNPIQRAIDAAAWNACEQDGSGIELKEETHE